MEPFRKKKDDRLPRKFTEYMYQLDGRRSQNGAVADLLTTAPAALTHLQPEQVAISQHNPEDITPSRTGFPLSPPGLSGFQQPR